MIPASERKKELEHVMDLEAAERWLQLSNQADEIFIMWFKLVDKQIAETFWIWYLRLIKERSAVGLDAETVWRLMEVINA